MFDLDSFVIDLNKRKALIDLELEKYMPPEDAFPSVIHQAMRYAIFNGGKRLRPIMVIEGARIAGGSAASILPVACALEMIHSYSLVHDDLPAMDDDDLRRGKPTCHRVFGEANAILTGDALLTAAFEGLAAEGEQGKHEPMKILRVMREIAAAAGSQGMVGGQVLDLDAQQKADSFDLLQTLHQLKTGELFKASLRAGAILGGMDEAGLASLTGYAIHFGLAFQITDDILDVSGDQLIIGKPVGSDEKNGKATFTSLFGLDGARKMAEDSVENCLQCLGCFGSEADFLRSLARFTLMREG